MNLRNPDLYHGEKKDKNFFEGWYFKISDKSGKHVLAFIPGISLGRDKAHSHSFLQVVNGINLKYDYVKYETEGFKYDNNDFKVEVNDNSFSLDGFSLNIDEDKIKVSGEIVFKDLIEWPDSLVNPGSMGFYNYLTFMECYSQVCAVDIALTGTLNINGEDISFNGGKGYIEKNWGREFPYSWIWVQANNFKNNRASLTCSIGKVPFLFTSFKGFLIGLTVDDNFYKFTTINRSKLLIKKTEVGVHIECINKKHILNIEVKADKKGFMTLQGPRDGKMIPLVDESISGEVYVRLICRKSKIIIFEDISIAAGVEYGGEQRIMIDGF